MSTTRWLPIMMWACATLLAASPAVAATEITGKVVLSGKAVADAVISIEGIRQESASAAAVSVMDHRGLNFVPHVLVIRTGSAVRFENSDGMPCRIYSISPAGNFVLRPPDGRPMTITFDHAGIIEVRCADHGRLHAYVLVKENPFFALTDGQGQYKIAHVPPGRYTLQAWYEGQVIESQVIEVGTDPRTIDFKAPRPQRQAGNEPAPNLSPLDGAPVAQPSPLSSELLNEWRYPK